MQYFPLFIDTKALRVLVVGAGEVAARKLDLLARTDAIIEVIAPQVSDEVMAYATNGRITLIPRPVIDSDLDSHDLVYLATANTELNVHLAELARSKRIWANAVDNPQSCRFITPSMVERGKLVVAISTAGSAPVFARDIRSRLETWLPQSLRPLFDFVADKRSQVQDEIEGGKARRQVWERFFQLNGDRFDEHTQEHFTQALVGGSAEGVLLLLSDDTPLHLLPIGAMPLLQKIDKVSSEQHLPKELLELVRRDASRVELISTGSLMHQIEHGGSILVYAEAEYIANLKAAIPSAKHIQPGAL